MRLSEANRKIKNKIAKVAIPGCPLSTVQAGDGWIKIQFRGADKTFLLKPFDPSDNSYKKEMDDFIPHEGDAQRIREIAGRSRRVSIVRRPGDDERALRKKISDEICNIADQVWHVLESGMSKIIDMYGLNCDFSILYRPSVPDAAETAEVDGRVYYSLGAYDRVRGAELWAPAMDPPVFASKMLKNGNAALNESGNAIPALDEAHCPFPEFDAEDGK